MSTAETPVRKPRARRGDGIHFAPPGHFYSPIGDRQELRAYYGSEHYRRQCDRVDAMLDYAAMLRQWPAFEAAMVAFPMARTEGFRYYGLNNQLPYFDASILSAMIARLNPRRIIEIGAGYSSAAMFDTIDRMKAPRLTRFITIDPDLSRVRALNPPKTAEMIAAPVQSVPVEVFAELAAGDILFIDSSHVLKTGSDVQYEYLHILPALRAGVHVHIHDIHYPFDYPRGWAVQENRSWNEVHLVDMMLTHGTDYEIDFFTDAFLRRHGETIRADSGMFARFMAAPTRPFHNQSGSIWLTKRGRRGKAAKG